MLKFHSNLQLNNNNNITGINRCRVSKNLQIFVASPDTLLSFSQLHVFIFRGTFDAGILQ